MINKKCEICGSVMDCIIGDFYLCPSKCEKTKPLKYDGKSKFGDTSVVYLHDDFAMYFYPTAQRRGLTDDDIFYILTKGDSRAFYFTKQDADSYVRWVGNVYQKSHRIGLNLSNNQSIITIDGSHFKFFDRKGQPLIYFSDDDHVMFEKMNEFMKEKNTLIG